MKKISLLISIFIVTGCATQPLNTGTSPSPQPTISSIPTPSVTVQPTVTTQPTTLPSATNSPNTVPTNFPTPISSPLNPSGSPSPITVSYEDATPIETLSPSSYLEPFISMNPDGKFVFGYTIIRKGETITYSNGESNTPLYDDTYSRTFNSLGTPVSNELKIKENTRMYDIAIDKDGNFFTLYMDMANQAKLYLRKYDINGVPLTDETLISDKVTNFPNLKINTAGEIFISWVNGIYNQNPNPENNFQIYDSIEIVVQKFDPSLKLVSEIYRKKINSINNLPNMKTAIDKEDNFYICWNDDSMINLTKFNPQGELLTYKPDLLSINNTPFNLLLDNQGNPLIAWFKGSDTSTVYLRKYENNISTFKEVKVGTNKYRADSAKPPYLTVDSNNNVTVGWTGNDTVGYPVILIRKYDDKLVPATDEILIKKLDTPRAMVYVTTDKNDILYVFFRGEGAKAYLKRYDKNGILLK
jgi:hypothetical protein